MSKKILLATRPLIPPWDEASKNFAYYLGREVRNHFLTLLTADTLIKGLPQGAHQEPIFSSSHFGLREKGELLRYLHKARGLFDVTHYLFTPTKLNTSIIKWFARPIGKTIQTVATLRDDLYSSEELRSLFFADLLVTYTKQTKNKLEGLGFQNVRVVYPGIDLKRYSPREKNDHTLNQLGFDKSHFLVIYPGEYTRLGATDMLVEYFIDFFMKNPNTDIRFIFACRVKNEADEKKKEWVKESFLKANVLRYISFSDTIADMAALYNTADIVIFPVSNLQGKFDVPLVIIEAYASGKAVILSRLPQFKEFANEHICVTIPKDSGRELIKSIAYLRDNKEIRETIGREARAFAKEHCNLEKTAPPYEENYNNL